MLTQAALEQMVEQQVRAWDVLDERVLDTFRQVPRERFVPPEHRYLAYADVSVPLPHGQHMLPPNVAGRLLQALELTGTERALEVGAGTGFLTACLAHSCASVVGVELFPELAELAQANLAAIGARNAEVAVADAMQLDASTKYERHRAYGLASRTRRALPASAQSGRTPLRRDRFTARHGGLSVAMRRPGRLGA